MTEETKKISKITKIISSYELVNDEEDFYDSEEENLKVRDVSKVGHWGMGDAELLINNESDLEWALPIIKKAYNQD